MKYKYFLIYALLCWCITTNAQRDSIEIVHKMLIGAWADQSDTNNEVIVTKDSIKQYYKWDCKDCIKLEDAYSYRIMHKSCIAEDTSTIGWYLYIQALNVSDNNCQVLTMPLESFFLQGGNGNLSGIYIRKDSKREN